MKRFILIAGALCLVAVAVYAESTKQKNTGAGLQIGTTSTQKIGFFGADPVAKQTGVTATGNTAILSNQLKAATTQAALTVSTQTITDKNDVVVNVVTGVTVNVIYGFASSTAGVATNEVVGTAATASGITNVVNAMRNLGLAGN